MKWYARYDLVALVFMTAAWICACEKPQNVARCVEWCESIKRGCGFTRISYPLFDAIVDENAICSCECSARVVRIVEQQARHADGGAR